MKFCDVYEAVKTIPKGKVSTYGDIAAVLGERRNARIVGWALHVNPEAKVIPCHRVVKEDGSLSEAFKFGGENIQRIWLEAEGVGFTSEGKVDMEKYKNGNS